MRESATITRGSRVARPAVKPALACKKPATSAGFVVYGPLVQIALGLVPPAPSGVRNLTLTNKHWHQLGRRVPPARTVAGRCAGTLLLEQRHHIRYQARWSNGYWKIFDRITFADGRTYFTKREAEEATIRRNAFKCRFPFDHKRV